MTPRHPRLVEVFWVDSAFHRGWSDADRKVKEMSVAECRSVGYLLERSPKTLKLTMSSADAGTTFSDGMSIPAVAVRRVRFLK